MKVRLDAHGRPSEAVVANAGIPGLDRLPPSQQALVRSIYNMDAGQLMAYVNDLADRLAAHAVGAGYKPGDEVKGLIASGSNDVAGRAIADKLAQNESVRKLLTT